MELHLKMKTKDIILTTIKLQLFFLYVCCCFFFSCWYSHQQVCWSFRLSSALVLKSVLPLEQTCSPTQKTALMRKTDSPSHKTHLSIQTAMDLVHWHPKIQFFSLLSVLAHWRIWCFSLGGFSAASTSVKQKDAFKIGIFPHRWPKWQKQNRRTLEIWVMWLRIHHPSENFCFFKYVVSLLFYHQKRDFK